MSEERASGGGRIEYDGFEKKDAENSGLTGVEKQMRCIITQK
jgi:hypothetical protein